MLVATEYYRISAYFRQVSFTFLGKSITMLEVCQYGLEGMERGMRLRNVPGARDVMEEDEYVFTDAAGMAGGWSGVFGNDNPIHIEVGMGKGQFIMELAARNPQVNYVGIEKYSSVLVRAVEKQREAKLPNVRFIRMEAEGLCEAFGAGEVSRIYLNFSDPWPKDRHAKRRLTSRQFFERYDVVLAPGGEVQFKTDNVALFDWSLEEIGQTKWSVVAQTHDLHADEDMNRGNVMTEYEQRFSSMGNPICKLVARR
jgi:tRNA (guanine-N7-)-methyltransferase